MMVLFDLLKFECMKYSVLLFGVSVIEVFCRLVEIVLGLISLLVCDLVVWMVVVSSREVVRVVRCEEVGDMVVCD